MNSIGRPSGSWHCKSQWTSFTSAITLRAAKVSSLQSMHLLVGKIRRAVNKQMRNWDKLQSHILLWILTCSWQLSRCTWGIRTLPRKCNRPKITNKGIKYYFLIMLSSSSLPSHQNYVFTLLSPFLSDPLLWVLHSFERLTLLSGPLSWALYWVTNSFEHSF